MTEPTIVHISCDFPDPLAPNKTVSVRNLINNTPGYRHVVYSLNRVSGRFDLATLPFGQDRTAMAYGAPPYGLLHATSLERVADWILEDLVEREISVSCLHVHKLSVEGLIGLRLGRALERPFICNIWGDTDLRITSARRDLAPAWRAILAEAAAVVPGAPWTLDRFETLYGLDRSKCVVLPPIIFHEDFRASPVSAEPHFVTLMNLNSHRRKNFPMLVKAFAKLSKVHPGLRLNVYGACAPAVLFELRDIIRTQGAQEVVILKGPLPNETFSDVLGRHVGFVMPTRRETFGMVFIEALFAGVPILHTRGWGVDGFLDNDAIGYACTPTDQADIEQGIVQILANQSRLKASIAALHDGGQLEVFTRRAIVGAYQDLLNRVIGGASEEAA